MQVSLKVDVVIEQVKGRQMLFVKESIPGCAADILRVKLNAGDDDGFEHEVHEFKNIQVKSVSVIKKAKPGILLPLNKSTAGTIFNGYIAEHEKAMEVAPTLEDAATLALKFISKRGDKEIVAWHEFLRREASYLVAEQK